LNKKLFWMSAISYFILMVADEIVTFIGTPDLMLESNPLITQLGLGWEAMLIANIICYLLFIFVINYGLVRYKSPVLNVEDYGQYYSMLYFNNATSINKFFRLPKNWKPIFACVSFTIAITLPLGRIIVVLEWLLYLLNFNFEFIGEFGYKAVILLLSTLICISYWPRKQFKDNLIYKSSASCVGTSLSPSGLPV